ncbi:hypothetical protein ARMGADRAFT_587381 [Armillaria gallica]|uniref:Uncharacterized protein n=1 Tax=Armillaria gallica TaxID=47427 RepID=A0A2H3E4S6_ARMGA|nr:hypothetical protein ARMGADRAFT_587381 [Armillaria gallica]
MTPSLIKSMVARQGFFVQGERNLASPGRPKVIWGIIIVVIASSVSLCISQYITIQR